jgi:hypothetical protein
MTTRTTSELSKAVMQKLAVIDAMESPSAQDHVMINARYEELMEGLREENLAYWENSTIPLVVFPALTDLVALHSGSAFGKPLAAVGDIEQAEMSIKRRIRRHTHKLSSAATIYQDDF